MTRRSSTLAAAALSAVLLGAPVALSAAADPAAAAPTAQPDLPTEGFGDVDGFEIPLDSTEMKSDPGSAARFDLADHMSTAELQQLDLTTLRFDNGLTHQAVSGQGTWSISGTTITFTPEGSGQQGPRKATIRVKSESGRSSLPTTITVSYPSLPYRQITASEGDPISVDLGIDDELVDAGSIRLSLDSMPGGTVQTDSGRRLVVPGEGTWSLSADGRNAVFTPQQPRLGRQPSTVSFTGTDRNGQVLTPGKIRVVTPAVPDIVSSAPFGDRVEFDLGAKAQNIDPATFELVPSLSDDTTTVNKAKDRVTVKGQGTWTLNRDAGTVVFTPEHSSVHSVSSMGVRGSDASGHTASIGALQVGYPQLSAQSQPLVWGEKALFYPLDGSLHVQQESLQFSTVNMPDGSELSSDGTLLTVPGEGEWEFNKDTVAVTFTPVNGLKKSPTPVTYTVNGSASGNIGASTLGVQYASRVPTLRDDDVQTGSEEAQTIDVLANDTPAAAADPFDAATLQLHSARATNISELTTGTGRRLEIPDEGVWEVTDAGAVRFTPVPGFRGRTTPVEYHVKDRSGLHSRARVAVSIDPQLVGENSSKESSSGINALLAGLRPEDSTMFAVYTSVTALLIFSGSVSLWVGRQIERGRRSQR